MPYIYYELRYTKVCIIKLCYMYCKNMLYIVKLCYMYCKYMLYIMKLCYMYSKYMPYIIKLCYNIHERRLVIHLGGLIAQKKFFYCPPKIYC